MKKHLVVIVGPTAVGKTDTAIKVARKLNGEIVSADSMQVYRYMDIGTAKPAKEEMMGIKHHMIDVVDPDKEYSVADFQRMAKRCIEEIYSKGKLPIVVGGTGLYVNSLVCNLDFTETVSNPELRDMLKKTARERGNDYLHRKLGEVDAETAARLHPNDVKRVIRALEVYYCTGKPISYYHKKSKEGSIPYNPIMIGLRMNRKDLYKRINQRVDAMIEAGLVDEVRRLLEMGCTRDMTSMQGLGYKEIAGYLQGEYSMDEAIEMIKRDTRRFAKRQFTWFRRDDRIFWIDVERYGSTDEVAQVIVKYVESELNN